MAEQTGEKKYEATLHRRQQARKQGQVARSQDLVAVALLFAGVSALLLVGDQAGGQLTWYANLTLRDSPSLDAEMTDVKNLLLRMGLVIAWIVAPLLALLLLVAGVMHLMQVGWLILPEKLNPDFRRINPAQGVKRLFSSQNLVRVVMGLAKMGVVMLVAFLALWQEREKLISVIDMSVSPKLLATCCRSRFGRASRSPPYCCCWPSSTSCSNAGSSGTRLAHDRAGTARRNQTDPG
ncbi:MAG: EscU/YscU/HrcU family type III secretion system export apparatus switch protein [Pirellulaceae bacterium]